MSESITCSHELVHIYDKHECDGCCARYTLTKPKPEITVRDFNNLTYDGPDCVCCKSKVEPNE
jgi:hypothetical protein